MKTTIRLLLLFLAFTATTMFARAQERKTISGTVLDSAGRGVPDVSVMVKGTKTGAVTDAQGNFKIAVAPNSTLSFSSLGYVTQEAPVGNEQNVVVTLQTSSKALTEVVVTGFGTRKDTRKLSYSVTEVKGSELTKANDANFVDALQGKVAGVYINPGAGGPSSSAQIRIRGNSRLDPNTQPLVVIDGILIEPGVTGANSWGGNQDFGNVIKDLNPDDYESVTVLKGSAASALYGSKALNGVLLITTKKGVARKGLGVTVSHNESYDKAYKLPDFQNEYGGGTSTTFATDAQGNRIVDQSASALNAPDGAFSYGPKFDGKPVKDIDGRTVPWVANNPLDFFQTGKYYNTNVAVEGGNEASTFRFSYSNLYNNSVMPNNNLKRNSFDLRATQKISKSISLDASINYTNNSILNPIIQGGNNNPIFGFSYYMPRNADINYYLNNYIDPVNGGRLPIGVGEGKDPYLLAYMFWNYFEINTKRVENNLLANLDIHANITPWLNLLIRSNLNNYNDNTQTKASGTGIGFSGGSYEIDQNSYRNVRLQGLLNITKKFGENFDLNASVGGETYRNLGGNYSAVSTNGGLTTPNIFTIANSINTPNAYVNDFNHGAPLTIAKKILDAVYAYGDLTWKNMLTLNFSLRNDWSSALTYADGHGDYSYLYPSIGAAWSFTELPYFKNSNSILSYGKLRASLGYTGYDASPYVTNQTGNYGLVGSFNNGSNSNQQIYTFNGSTLPNFNLKNELTHEIEFGANLQFFNNRLGIDAAYYKKNTHNQIIGLPTPVESGVSTRLINAGNIQNQGIELLLNATPVKSRNFTWNMTVNYTRNRNKIIELAPGVDSYTLELAFGADVVAEAIPGSTYGTVVTGSAFATYQAKDANGNPMASPSNGKAVIGTPDNAAYIAGAGAYYTYLRSSKYDGSTKTLGNIMENYLAGTTQEFNYKSFTASFQIDAKIGGLMASATDQYGGQTGAFTYSLFGRDAAHGGVTYMDANGIQHDDGIIPNGVLNDDVNVTVGGNTINLGGMSYADAVSKGYLKPVPAYAYWYNLTTWASGIRAYSVFENSWVAVRQVSLGYNLPARLTKKISMNSLRVSLIGRNLGYLYKTAKDGINPEGVYNNNSAGFAEYGGLPYIRSLGFSISAGF
jgi:iron complex outermembrane receptor protein